MSQSRQRSPAALSIIPNSQDGGCGPSFTAGRERNPSELCGLQLLKNLTQITPPCSPFSSVLVSLNIPFHMLSPI